MAQSLIKGLNHFIVSSIGGEDEKINGMKALHFEEKLRIVALEEARQELRNLRRQRKINSATMMTIIAKLDLRQITLAHSHQSFKLDSLTETNH